MELDGVTADDIRTWATTNPDWQLLADQLNMSDRLYRIERLLEFVVARLDPGALP